MGNEFFFVAKKAIKSPSKSTQRSKSTAKEETPKASQNKKGRTSKSPVKSTPHSAGRRTSAKKMVVNEEQEEIQTAVGEGSGGECANELKKTSDVDEAPSENVEIAEGAVETKLSPSRKRKREESEDRDSVTQNEPDAKVQKVLSEPSNEVKKIQEELQEDNAATEASSEKLLSEVSLDSGLNKLESEPMDTASGDIAVEAGTEVISSSDKVVNENDYEFISKDDVPPANSEEVLKAAEKMLPPPPQPVEAESAAADKGCTTNGNDVGNADVLFSREFVVSQATSTEQPSTRSFSIVSYNILADVHAQKDYTKDLAPWITGEQLAISSRHGQLMKELKFLDSDIICFQEVGGTYMAGLLTQDLEK